MRKEAAFRMSWKAYIVGFFLLGIFSLSVIFQFSSKWVGVGRKGLLDASVMPSKGLKREATETCKTKKKGKGIWTVNSSGRLGNQMGQFATLYALAKLNGYEAYLQQETFNWLAPIFKISLPVLHKDVVRKIPWKYHWVHDWMSKDYEQIEGKHVMISGYPCSWTFYHHIREEILQEFTFHDFIKDEVNKYLGQVRGTRKNATFVGVHVRRGDYVHVMPNTWKGVVADKAYLEKAMDYFRNKYQEPIFVVTSNGIQWCKENIDASRGDVYFSGDGVESSPGKDFALLAHCNHIIMTVGTFGYWAGYLAGGETIYLTNFTLPESEFLKLFHYDAAFLPEWKGIPADLSPLLQQPKPQS
ncbi:galactoside 2-alpha-L-fucosyltransferase 2-like [Microcaecilia unicolor]|uniref:L-Fucosyltransferase n=1 Tax=Microcaecilia unicolor TaxID=1415580 RepID=A0A6P7XSQ9_9AMPH|nr:galactoside 2-alpha-L-fucosyltransferase 2-like [Microcaecilia unicolor]XP_030053706.1 galactoside 2-alpha-L-fucosyltransferase 2-like [Microcaecilia unicolor]